MHVKRLTLIGIAAIAAGYTFLSNAGTAFDAPRGTAVVAAPECGLVPAPESPGFAGHALRRAEETARFGYQRVCQTDLVRFEVRPELKPLPLVLAGLDFQPVDLADTPIARLTSLGGMAEAVGQTRSRLYRSFRMSDGHTLTLLEHDQSADGSSGWREPAHEPERINGLPARLDVLQADAGKAVSVLSWQEGRRAYQMWIDANVAIENSREQFLALAAALPRSVPARPALPEAAPVALAPGAAP